VLKALLPERGTDIKGAVRSREQLLTAAGCARRPEDFTALLRILDTELRLITPTADVSELSASESALAEAGRPGSQPARYYQLTHDYLVPALREWLTRLQRETRRGRAELCLDERAAEWAARPDGHHLPSAGEWLRILLFTRSRDWTAPQRKMMRSATRRYALRLAAAAALVALLGWGAWEGRGHLQAAMLVRVLGAANTADVPATIRDLDGYHRWADPLLHRLATESPAGSRERLHASLALLPGDDSQVDYLLGRLLEAGPDELPVIRDALRPRRADVAPRLWRVLESDESGAGARACAGLALAGLDPPDGPDGKAHWQRHAPLLVEQFLSAARADPRSYAARAEALRPARLALLDALGVVFRDRRRPDYARLLATTLLADYAADQPEVLVELLKDADAEQFMVLLPKLGPFADQTATAMTAELVRETPPGASDREKETRALRQANAAVMLLHLGQTGPVWPLLRHRADPRLRSHLVHRLRALGADLQPLAQRLLAEPNVSARQALILSLGEYPADGLPAPTGELLAEQLLGWYRDDPDPGVHSAVEWLFRRWGLADRLGPVKESLAGPGPVEERRWYVNRQGQTFAVINGPVVVEMGSPPEEADRENEPIVRRKIGRSFAVATTPVTLGQFQRFLNALGWKHTYTRKYCPEPDCPVTAINWFTAAQYCRWLSEREGIPEDQMCFPPVDQIQEGMKLPADYLSRTGYRLLTEAEWEYACRAGAVTSRYHGTSEELLGQYGWYMGNSRVRTHPVGSLKPNDFGLFDMHGNVWQWCQERALASRPWGGAPAPAEDREDTEPVVELHGRVLRGGSFYDHSSFLRSAARQSNRPYMIDDY
jgi:formylglycine-generating enzyme required for sulfatase activity